MTRYCENSLVWVRQGFRGVDAGGVQGCGCGRGLVWVREGFRGVGAGGV